jgi:cell division protein FtsI (penicillin-binding protein 3)
MKFSQFRFYIVVTVLFSMFSVLALRAFYIQIIPNERLKSFQEKQFNRVVTLQPTRGVILDRNKKELASSITAYSLFADPTIVESPKSAALKIAGILGRPANMVYRQISDKNKRFVWLGRQMPKEKKDKIAKFNIKGLGFVEESKRIYPNHNLLSQTLGFVGQEGQGLGGLEIKFNEELSGAQKKMLIQRDARGRPLLANGKLFSEQPDGSTLELTIDSELQYILEQELKKSVLENNADSSVGVVMDAQTNEVIAMSSFPDFNPNEALDANPDSRKNRAVSDPFEPGSTLKTFVVAGALRAGLLEPNTKYYCEKGSMKVADRIIRESSSDHKFEWLTVSEILAKSSNIGMVKIGFQLGAQKTKGILDEFGFGQKTGITLGGDSKGIVPPGPWREVSLANISFGQGIAVSALQIANAYTAIANGGILREPLLVKSITDPMTEEKEEFESKKIRRILTEEQAKTMLLMLMGVTQDEGTAKNARVAGFPVAGKTGTAQKVDSIHGGYMKGAYVSSFAGIIPAHNPKYVIYVAVDNPKKKKYYGSEVAAPVFAKVASYAVRRAGMSPILLTEENVIGTQSKLEKKAKDIVMKLAEEVNKDIPKTDEDRLVGLTVREVMEKTQNQKDTQVKIFGSGESYRVLSETNQNNIKTLRIYFR